MLKEFNQPYKEWSRILICSGVLYIMLYTPLWDHAVTGVVAALIILLSLMQGHFKVIFRGQGYFIAVLLVLVTINIVLSALPLKAATGAVSVLKGLLLYPVALVAGRAMSENHFNRLGIVFILCNSLFLLALLFWVVNWSSTYMSLNVWSGKHLGNVHNLNNFVFVSNLLALTLLLKAKERWLKLLASAGLLLSLFVSVLVESEGSVLAMAVCLTALVALYTSGRWRLLFIGIAVLPLILLHLFYLTPDLFTQLTGHRSETMIIRSDIYQQLFSAWQEHPWSGWGMNTYKYVTETHVNGKTFIYPHHIYLEGLFSLGVLGGGFVLVWLTKTIRKIDPNRIQQSAISLFAFLALIYISVKGMSDMKFLSQQTIGWIVLCLGLLHGQQEYSLKRWPVHTKGTS